MKKRWIAALMLGICLPTLQACFPVVAAGVATGVMTAADRRSVGTQTEDEAIEWKASARVSEVHKGENTHFNFTSFNRKVLISGEVPSAEVKAEAERIVRGVPNVVSVHNELHVGPVSSLQDRSNDSFVTSKVKSRSLDNNSRFSPLQLKVVTEAGTVFLMGLMTQKEADAAINVARTTAGVRKVVSLFEIIAPAKAGELDPSYQSGNGQVRQETAKP